MRVRLVQCYVAVVASFVIGSPVLAAPKNVVLFVADDMGRDAGCYDNRVIKTPNLDRLAAEGTRFTHAFCTTASCSPSRSVILTGLHNHANGQYGLEHSYHKFGTLDSVRSLPAMLSSAGYRTCSIGKMHVGPKEVYPFDEFANDAIQRSRNGVQMAENARRFIAKDPARPFFLYFCTIDPHRDFGNNQSYPGIDEVTYDPKDVVVPPFLPDRPEVRQELAEYYQSVSRLDQGLGQLMTVLRETGHWNDTLIVFLSDNGIPFPGAKTTLYESGMRLPLVIRSPDQKKRGAACNAMVSWVDIMPTILDYAGVAPPKYGLHGRSLVPVLGETDPAGWDEVYGSHTFHEITMYYPMRVVRTRQYKYLLNLANELPYPFASDLYESSTWQGVLKRGDTTYGKRTVAAYIHRPRHELYDLEADPHEINNLADDPRHQATLRELQQKVANWQKSTRDPWTIKYVHE